MDRKEDENAIIEMDRQRQTIRSQLMQTRGSLQMKQKVKRRSELCFTELQTLPNDVVTYKAVGRMFLLTPLPDIQQELDALVKSSTSDLVKLEEKEKFLSREVQELDKSIQEIVGKSAKSQS